MTITVKQLAPALGAEIGGADLTRPVPNDIFAEIRAALDDYSVLVFRDQPLDDELQIAFSKRFGPLETSGKANPATGTHFARQSNLDIRTGEVIPPKDRRMIYQLANYLWHSDSSFKRVPSLCSLLSGRLVPPEGGNTEFAAMRAAYDDLPEETKQKIENLIAEHSLTRSREQVDPDVLTDEQKAEHPPVPQRVVRTVNGRKSLFVGAHASHIIGWPIEEGRALIKELIEFATQPKYCYSHAWRQGDLVIWDNRCVLHRATAYDTVKYKRLMQRTTVGGDRPTV